MTYDDDVEVRCKSPHVVCLKGDDGKWSAEIESDLLESYFVGYGRSKMHALEDAHTERNIAEADHIRKHGYRRVSELVSR